MIKLTGEITNDFGMWYSTIYQREDGKFVLEEESEMMLEPHEEIFDSLIEALKEMTVRT